MSAGTGATPAVDADLVKLAPRFRAAVAAAIAECNANGLDAKVFEGLRSAELQAIYYARGRTVIPPTKPVTNAQSNLYSWHGYGLAVDVISRSKAWDMPETWFESVATVFKKYGCAWGGDWKQRDTPHFQWGRCKPSPSDLARELISTQGMPAVWLAVGAADSPEATLPDARPLQISGVPLPDAPDDHAPASPPADIGKLRLNEIAQNGAVILKARFPSLTFTSGRRSLEDQARSMASNVVKDRRFIVDTYKPSPLRSACQDWIDGNPAAETQVQIEQGLLKVLEAAPEVSVMAFSKHLTGDAFDVQPVENNSGEIIDFIRRLPLLEKFLDHEGQLIRWHAQFYR